MAIALGMIVWFIPFAIIVRVTGETDQWKVGLVNAIFWPVVLPAKALGGIIEMLL